MFRTKKKKPQTNKHIDLQNTISFKIEMLQKDVQTLSSHCLSPVKIFCSTSSTSVPTQICCAWLHRWKDVQIKGPITASVTLYPISHGEALCNPSWRCKQFEISWRLKCSKDKRHHYMYCICGGIPLTVIIRDMRLLSCSICNFIWELEPFSSLIISQALAMKTSESGL